MAATRGELVAEDAVVAGTRGKLARLLGGGEVCAVGGRKPSRAQSMLLSAGVGPLRVTGRG